MRILSAFLALAALAYGDTSPREVPPRALIWASGTLMLVSPSSGKVYWTVKAALKNGHRYWIDTGVTTVGRRVVIANSTTNQIEAYDLRSGRQAWTHDFTSDHVFLTSHESGKVFASGYSRAGTVCIDAKTGKQLWKYEGGRGYARGLNGGAVVGQRGSAVAMLDEAGSEKWAQTGVNWVIGSTDKIAVGSNWSNKTIGFRVSDGTQLWEVDRNTWEGTIVDDTVLLGGYYGHVTAVDLKSGREKWSFNDGTRANAYRVVHATRDCVLASAVSKSTVYCISMKDGSELFQFNATNRNLSYHGDYAVLRDRVLTKDGNRVICRGLPDGRSLWTRDLEQPVTGLLGVAGTLIVGTGGRTLGLNPATGKVRWTLDQGGSQFFGQAVRF